MFGSLLILLVLPLTDLSRIRGNKFRPFMKIAFWFFVVDFVILTWIGSQHPTTPYVEIGQIATVFYFAWFLVIVPIIGLFENTTLDIALDKNINNNTPSFGNFSNSNSNISNSIHVVSIIGSNKNVKYENNKSTWTRIKVGVKRAKELPVLPSHINIIDSNIYTRIFKILGAISVFLSFSHLAVNNFNVIGVYVIELLATSYIIYKIVIVFYIIKQFIVQLLKGDFIVRNSPLDSFATLITVTIKSIRATASVTVGTGLTYALCHELDDILVNEGKDPYFVLRMTKVLEKTGLKPTVIGILTSIGITDSVPVSSEEKLSRMVRTLSLTEEEKLRFYNATGKHFSDFQSDMLALNEASDSTKQSVVTEVHTKNKG